ncbi:MAG: alpha/beta fold hydrolase [Acidimicrobiales bacterium]
MPSPATTMVRSTDGVELAVHDFGGHGPTILFAHATGFHGMVWSPVIADLIHSHRCVSLDFRGHGDSSVPDHGSFLWSGFADDVQAVVSHLGDPRPLYGVGHSKGGAALLLAEQRAPGTFSGLYLFEPIVLDPERRANTGAVEGNPLALGALKRREVFASRDDAYDNYRSKPPLDALTPEALRAYVDHGFTDLDDGTVRLKCRGADESQVYASSGTHDTFDHLDRVRCPVTVAAGAAEEGLPAVIAPGIADRLPRGTFRAHPDLGHFGPLQAPGLIADEIRTALDR